MIKLIIFLFFCVVAVIKFTAASNLKDGSSLKLQEMAQLMSQHKQKIEMYSTALEAASDTLSDINRKLHEVEEFVRSIESLQESQLDNYNLLVDDAKALDDQMQHELAEKDARIAQLEYNIMTVHIADPYVEKFDYPIYKFWIVVDSTKKDSNWEFKKGNTLGGETELICQSSDLSSNYMPASLLILKARQFSKGFVYSAIQLPLGSLAILGNGAAGLVFFFVNSKNFWIAELSRHHGQGEVSLSKVSDGFFTKLATKPLNVEPDVYYKLACRFSTNLISVFVNGGLKLEVDLSSAPSTIIGSTGLFTRVGKANFQHFVTGLPRYEKLAPEGAFETIYKTNMGVPTRKVTEEEQKAITAKELPKFKERDLYDNQVVKQVSEALHEYDDPIDKFKKDFLPNSDKHVPEQDPLPEIPQNLYREKKILIEKPVEVVAATPFCAAYQKPDMEISDWLQSDKIWEITTELGTQRFDVPRGVKIGQEPQMLFLKDRLCNSGSYSVKIRLEDDSAGGLVFRASDKANTYAATYNTNTKILELQRQVNGRIEVLKSIVKPSLNSQFCHKLTVIDHGAQNSGLIQVFLDDQLTISYSGSIYQNYGKAGIVLRSGYGLFDSFTLLPVEYVKQ